MRLTTERLILRPWQAEDMKPFAALNADLRVMEFLPSALSHDVSDALAIRLWRHIDEHGWGLWAVEIPGVAPFAGFIGLSEPQFESHFTPCVEVGWRLARDFWGHGYATEGARAALAFAFDSLHLDEVVSFTVPANIRSRRVMDRLGMTHRASDEFDHPRLPSGHPLRRHVLYRIHPQREGSVR